jgi:hypothetical protein
MLALTPPPVSPSRPAAGPDVAAAAVPLLRKLRDALAAALPRPDRWGVPRLFFFRPELQEEWEAVRPPARPLDAPTLDLLDDAVSVLAASPDARKAGRATPGLLAAARAAAPLGKRPRELADLLDLLDDEVVRVVHPRAGAGWRVRVRGVADVGQFHALVADAVVGSPARGKLPGLRPDARAVAVYRGEDDGPAVLTARFRLLSPTALEAGLPDGPAGAGHWLFPAQPLRSVPRTPAGERAVLLADVGIAPTWPAERRCPRVAAAVDVLATMTAAEVRDWLADRGAAPDDRLTARAA